MSSRILVDEIYGKTSGTSAIEIDSSGLVSHKTVAMVVEATNTDQSISAQVATKVEWEDVQLDTVSGWDSDDHRYIPTVAGWYAFGGVIRGNFSTAHQYLNFRIKKNNVDYLIIQFQTSTDTFTNGAYPLPTGMVQMNGTTDYLEVFVTTDEASTIHDNATPSHFFVHLVHAV